MNTVVNGQDKPAVSCRHQPIVGNVFVKYGSIVSSQKVPAGHEGRRRSSASISCRNGAYLLRRLKTNLDRSLGQAQREVPGKPPLTPAPHHRRQASAPRTTVDDSPDTSQSTQLPRLMNQRLSAAPTFCCHIATLRHAILWQANQLDWTSTVQHERRMPDCPTTLSGSTEDRGRGAMQAVE